MFLSSYLIINNNINIQHFWSHSSSIKVSCGRTLNVVWVISVTQELPEAGVTVGITEGVSRGVPWRPIARGNALEGVHIPGRAGRPSLTER